MIGAWGSPVKVGVATIHDTRRVAIEFDDHQLVEEFYDLHDKELVVTVSFLYNTTKPDQPNPTT
jgi:hypothetical protein